MAKKDYIEQYSIGVGFDFQSMKSLEDFLKQVKKNIEGVKKDINNLPKTISTPEVKPPKQPKNTKSVDELKAYKDMQDAVSKDNLRNIKMQQSEERRLFDIVENGITARKKKEGIRAKQEEALQISRIHHNEFINNSLIRQHVQELTRKDEQLVKMKDYYKAQEKSAVKMNAAEQKMFNIVEKGIADRKKKEAARSDQEDKLYISRLQNENTISSARMRQHIHYMTYKDDELSRMSSYYKEQERLSAKTHNAEMKRRDAVQKRWDARKTDRLRGIDEETNRTNKLNAALEKQVAAMRRTASYQYLKEQGKAGKFDNEINTLMLRPNANTAEALKDLNAQMRQTTRQMRKMVGLQTMQGGLIDSTRNLVRSFASLYAVLATTAAIEQTGMQFQAMEASMLAASGSAEAAAKDVKFLDNMVQQMGLNLKDTTDAFVKFKFAAQGKLSQEQTEDIFTSLSMLGTSLRIGTEDMKRAQKAIIQMVSKGKVMAKTLWPFYWKQ